MIFSFDQNLMLNEISIAQEVITLKNAMSILSNILLDARDGRLVIKATDEKVNFLTSIPVDVKEAGSTTVHCDKFFSILTGMDEGEIIFSLETKANLTIANVRHSSKKIKFKLKCWAQDKFPYFPDAKNLSFFEMPAPQIKNMFLHTSYAVSTDEFRHFITGVFLTQKDDKLISVSTDGRRLAYESQPFYAAALNSPDVIIPPKVLNIITKKIPDEGNVELAMSEKMIFFRFANYEFSSLLIDGQFPNYQRVIPENQAFNLIAEKNLLADAIRRVGIMADKKSNKIFFNIASGVLKISSPETESGEAEIEIPCQYSGDEFIIALNLKYVDDAIKATKSKNIKLEFSGELKPVTLKPEPADDYFHIIMPMQRA